MKSTPLLLLINLMIIQSCSIRKTNPINQNNYSDALALKNIALCSCVNRAVPLSDQQWHNDGSISVYVQLSEVGEKEIDTTMQFVQVYLDTAQYYSSTDSNLGLMKCINFYNSKELENFVQKVLKGKK
jgi:hypothetical protein